jgi:HEAT repeat protein
MAVTVVHAEPQPDPAAQARRILQEGVESKDSAVRIQAITAASLVGNHEVVLKSLEASLQDKSVAVRLAAVHALADIGSPQSVQALQQVLQDDKVPEVYFAAAKALAKLHDPEGTRALMEVFEGKRKASSNIIEKQKREATDQFHSVPSAMMFMVSHGIGYVPIPGVGEGFSALTALTHDVELSDRATVILILGQSKSGESRELLSRALDDKDWSVRAAAVQMIAQGARVEMRNQLLPLFDDTNHKVRFRAAGAYLHLALIKSH